MSELDSLIDSMSATPAFPKKMPVSVPPIRTKKADKIKETAIAIIDDTLKNKRDATDKILAKVDKSTVPVKAVYEAFQNFEAAVGGREQLVQILQHCPETSTGYSLMHKLLADPDFLEYARRADDTDNVAYSLAAICYRHKIPFNAVVTAFKDAKTAEITIKTLQSLSAEVPKVVEQLAQDAQNSYQTCHLCEGTTRIWRIGEGGEWLLDEDGEHLTQLCHNCRGKGKVFKEHDVQNRKEFLKIVGISEDRKGPLVQVTNQSATVIKADFLPGDGSFEKLTKAIDAMIIKKPTATEAIDVPYAVYEEAESTPQG